MAATTPSPAAPRPSRRRTDYDGVWKFGIQHLLAPFLWFFFPDVAARIDWGRSVAFLEQELKRISRRARIGRRSVDVLVQVWLLSGEEEWLLVHIEVQSQTDERFAERMFVYSYRI